MPIYEYRCKDCSNKFDEQRCLAEYDLPTKEPCKECGGVLYIALHWAGMKLNDLPHKSLPTWYTDRITEIKKKYPGNNI